MSCDHVEIADLIKVSWVLDTRLDLQPGASDAAAGGVKV